MNLVLHIGTEKTGTTSIQNVLANNRAELGRAGYHFLQCAGEKNNRGVPAACVRDGVIQRLPPSLGIDSEGGLKAYREKLHSEFADEIKVAAASGCHTVIISSEHFHSRTNVIEDIERVRDWMAPYFVESQIICYFREQVSACESAYSTALKSGSVESLESFAASKCKVGRPYFDHFKMIGQWAAVFPDAKLDLGIYDRLCLKNGDVVDDFFHKIDSNLLEIIKKEGQESNESLNVGGQKLARVVNVLRRQHPEYSKKVNKRFMAVLRQHYSGAGGRLALQERTRIESEFAASNEALRCEYFPDMEQLFRPRATTPEMSVEASEEQLFQDFARFLRLVS